MKSNFYGCRIHSKKTGSDKVMFFKSKAFLIAGFLSIIMALSSCAVSQQCFTDSIYSRPGNKTIKTTTATSNEDEEEVRITDDGDIEIGGFHIYLTDERGYYAGELYSENDYAPNIQEYFKIKSLLKKNFQEVSLSECGLLDSDWEVFKTDSGAWILMERVPENFRGSLNDTRIFKLYKNKTAFELEVLMINRKYKDEVAKSERAKKAMNEKKQAVESLFL